MFIPKYFRINDLGKIEEFIRKNSFAILISVENDVPLATHIPVELEKDGKGKNVLRGHVARGNPQWKSFKNSGKVLVIFSGPHHYISSSWYNHVNVPTWNYVAVHISGRIKIVDGAALYRSLNSLVEKYESASANPVNMESMTDDVHQQMKGIVGFEIEIETIEGKWKMSQNRDDEDFGNIIEQLEKLNTEKARLVAAEMKSIRKP